MPDLLTGEKYLEFGGQGVILEVSGRDVASLAIVPWSGEASMYRRRRQFTWLVGLSTATWLLAAAAQAEDKSQPGERVELFAAMEAKQVDVKLIPKNAEQATVVIHNRTDKPLSIQLPEAFAGLPVLAQNQNAGGANPNRNVGGGGNNNANQGMGGGMGMGMGMGGMGMGGFFNVGPDRVGKIKVQTVCLEHGKEDPNPRVPYELRPITSFTQKAELIEMCKMLGRGEIDQVSAQAAAWHLSDGLTWDQLAQKVKIRHLNGQTEMYFSPSQLQQAMQAVRTATERTRDETPETVPTTSPGETLSQR